MDVSVFHWPRVTRWLRADTKYELVHTAWLYSKLVPDCPVLTHTWLLLYWRLAKKSESENYLADLAVLVGF